MCAPLTHSRLVSVLVVDSSLCVGGERGGSVCRRGKLIISFEPIYDFRRVVWVNPNWFAHACVFSFCRRFILLSFFVLLRVCASNPFTNFVLFVFVLQRQLQCAYLARLLDEATGLRTHACSILVSLGEPDIYVYIYTYIYT